MTRDEAVEAARALLTDQLGEQHRTLEGLDVVLIEDNLTEYDEAWLVPFNSRQYLEEGDFSAAMVPSAILVPKDLAVKPHVPPSVFPTAVYLAKVASGEMAWSGQQRG